MIALRNLERGNLKIRQTVILINSVKSKKMKVINNEFRSKNVDKTGWTNKIDVEHHSQSFNLSPLSGFNSFSWVFLMKLIW